MATTATAIIYGAFDLIGVIAAGDTLEGNDFTDGYRRLQNMVGTLGLQPATAPFVGREVFPLVAGQGGTLTPYTIGIGGDFNTTRPASLDGAGIILDNTLPLAQQIESPRGVLTDAMYQAIQIKDLPNSLFTGVYYSTEFAGGLGAINLYPVPDNNLTSLVLYRRDQMGLFSSPTATYEIPPGYDEMYEYQLALRLAGPYHRDLPPYVQQMAVETLAIVKRANARLRDLSSDAAPVTNDRHRTYYNILTSNQ